MLEELVNLLEAFEWVTNELQGNKVTISKVYPCIEFLFKELNDPDKQPRYTVDLRTALSDSLKARFGVLIKNEVFVISSFLGNVIFFATVVLNLLILTMKNQFLIII